MHSKNLWAVISVPIEGNYGDYNITEEIIKPYKTQVEEFKSTVLTLLQQAGYKINNES